MKKIIYLSIATCLCLSYACTKDEYKMAAATAKDLVGTYKKIEGKTEVYDTMGNFVSKENDAPRGTMTLAYQDAASGSFNTVRFKDGGQSMLYAYAYFDGHVGIDTFADGATGFYYQVDLYKKRINFWCIAPMSNYHHMVNYELSNGKLTLFYILPIPFTAQRKYVTLVYQRV